MKGFLAIILLSFGSQVYADVDPQFRRDNAVVLYDFAETNGPILDRGKRIAIPNVNPVKYYPQVDLEPLVTGPTLVREAGALTFEATNALVSIEPADKLTNTCKASGQMSFEVWLENNESVQERSGFDSAVENSKRPHPLRILNLSQKSALTEVNTNVGGSQIKLYSPENLYNRNFVFGQFYDMGNLYQTGVRTNANEGMAVAGRGNSLVDPLESSVAQTIVPDSTVGRLLPTLQKVVFTLSPAGVGRLYLSDLNGNMYLAQEKTNGYKGNNETGNMFSNWHSNAFLSLGNSAMSLEDFNREKDLESKFSTCTTCYNLKNRYWKGKLRLVAVYCKELSRAEVLGAAAVNSVIRNEVYPIDINTKVTPTKLRAQEIFNRLTGAKIPVSDPRIANMEAEIQSGNQAAAAAIATSDPRFLNVTVRDFAAKMSNRDQTVNVPLNDFIATIIGVVRDNINAKELLTSDITYIGNPALAPVPTSVSDDILRSNNHYLALEEGRYDLGKVLMRSTQKIFNGTRDVANPDPAGLLTSRQWMAEHAIAGTNRRLIEYTFKEFLCTPLESVADSSGPDNVVGPDIDRFPGGSHTKFTTSCRACHTILDGFRPAYARWTFGNGFAKNSYNVPAIGPTADENMGFGMQINPTYPAVTAKLNRNADVFPDGRKTVDSNWVNNAVFNSNATTFKFTKTSGTGVRDFGITIAGSPRFARCMAERVFRQVCKRDHQAVDAPFLDQVAADFSRNSFNLKNLFEKVVTSENCLGGN